MVQVRGDVLLSYATAATAAPRTSAPPLVNPLTSPLSRRHQVRPAESMKEAHQIVRGMSLRVVDGHQLHFDEVFVALCRCSWRCCYYTTPACC